MVNQETRFNVESEFAAKCRVALEKNAGMKIPKPNCLKEAANSSTKSNTEEQ